MDNHLHLDNLDILDLLLVLNSNCSSILHHYWHIWFW